MTLNEMEKELMARARAAFALECAAHPEMMYLRRDEPYGAVSVEDLWIHGWLAGRIAGLRDAESWKQVTH